MTSIKKYTIFVVLILMLLGNCTKLFAGEQTAAEKKSEFRRLVLKRNQLHSKLCQLDSQAARALKNEDDPTRIHAQQVTTQDQLDLVQLKLETLAVRNGYAVPEPPANSQDEHGRDGALSYNINKAFDRGRNRTKQELTRQTLKLLARIDFDRFLEKVRGE